MQNSLIKLYGDNLIAAMQSGNRDRALFWQTKMYDAIKRRNAAIFMKERS